jgi:hypothetical protein
MAEDGVFGQLTGPLGQREGRKAQPSAYVIDALRGGGPPLSQGL